MTGTGEVFAFWILAPLAVLGALGLIFAKKAVHAALGMALTMILLGVFYVIQEAPFLGAIQIVVYTGAVMMLFLFVIMLVGVDSSDSLIETIKGQRWAAIVLGIGLAVLLFAGIGSAVFDEKTVTSGLAKTASRNATVGNVTGIAELIFGKYVWVFELTSALLITAAMSAMVLAHRERLAPKTTQAELAARRVKLNKNVAGLPAPGVYARHNAVDTPALLPDGTPSQLSVSRVLVARDQVANTDGLRDLERHMLPVTEAGGEVGADPRTEPASEYAANESFEPAGEASGSSDQQQQSMDAGPDSTDESEGGTR